MGTTERGKMVSVRTAKELIDEAISENRFAERLMYCFAIVFVVSGVVMLGVAAYTGNLLSAFTGTVSSGLFWPAMTSARRTRKENIAIRLLEAPLSRADTAKDAAVMLRQLVDELLRDTNRDG